MGPITFRAYYFRPPHIEVSCKTLIHQLCGIEGNGGESSVVARAFHWPWSWKGSATGCFDWNPPESRPPASGRGEYQFLPIGRPRQPENRPTIVGELTRPATRNRHDMNFAVLHDDSLEREHAA